MIVSNASIKEKLLPFFHSLHQFHQTKLPSQHVFEFQQDYWGFHCFKTNHSTVCNGNGVFIQTQQPIPPGQIVAIYPGTVYDPHQDSQSLFLQSIGNHFLLKRKDAFIIDGNDRYFSKMIYQSISERGKLFDNTWLSWRKETTPLLRNPLHVGHYINSGKTIKGKYSSMQIHSNVTYMEFDFEDWPQELFYLIGNVHFDYHSTLNNHCIRSAVLISTRTIQNGEELLSEYYSEVPKTI